MDNLLALVLFTPAAAATIVALLTTLVFLLPRRTERAQTALETTPGRSFVIGLVNFVFFGAIAAVLSQGGDFLGLIAFVILLALLSLAMIGMAGLVAILRQRLYPSMSAGASPPSATIRASALLVLAMLAPLIGWFALIPILVLLGLGAGIIAMVRRTAVSRAPDDYGIKHGQRLDNRSD